MTKNKVTTFQFYSLLYICSVVAAFMFVSTTLIDLGSTDAILFPSVFGILSLLTIIPTFAFNKKSKGESVLTAIRKRNKLFSDLVAFPYIILVFVLLLRTLARLDLFVSSEVFPENTMTFLIVSIVIVSVFLSLLDIGALSRASTIFLIMVTISVSIVVTSAFSNIEMVNIVPFFMNGETEFFKQALAYSVFFPESACLILFLSNIKGDIKKGYLLYILFLVFSLTIVSFTVVGALGEFSNTQLFPAFAISSVGEFRVLERFESIQSSVWTVCIIAKTTLQIMIISNCIRHLFPKIKWWTPNALTGIAATAFIIYISNGVTRFSFMSSQLWVTVSYILLVVVLPSIAFVSMLKKKRGENLA